MQSLEDFNIEAQKDWIRFTTYPKLNNLACPKCGKEMYDTDASILCSNPPQKNVHCTCGFRGYRYA